MISEIILFMLVPLPLRFRSWTGFLFGTGLLLSRVCEELIGFFVAELHETSNLQGGF